jgi:hypothetical protein
VLASAYGTSSNSAAFLAPLQGTAQTLPLNSASNLNNMTVSGNNLCATQSGTYLITYNITSSSDVANYLTYALTDSAGAAIPGGTVTLNTNPSDEEATQKTALVNLNAGDCLHLTGLAQNGGNIYIPANGASITAVKINN